MIYILCFLKIYCSLIWKIVIIMNKIEFDILKYLLTNQYETQRMLAETFNCSLGNINNIIKKLVKNNYIDSKRNITEKTKTLIKNNSPKNAIILAAGYGMRMAPINTLTPKGLLQVKNEVLIERIIRQLRESRIEDIHIIVGFMKEQYEYLIDKYGVNLIVNENYSKKNNLHSLALAAEYISNTYIIPCDIWCEDNPFSSTELYSWYMITNNICDNTNVRTNKKRELVKVKNSESGNKMIGIAYLTNECAKIVKSQLLVFDNNIIYNNSFWEESLFNNNKMRVWANIVDHSKVFEIDTFEQLRELDENSYSLKTKPLSVISKVFNVDDNMIKNISVLKKGMTNRSFIFEIDKKKYIMRIPGEGTEQLINRYNESQVYNAINHKNLCEKVLYINAENGYKITEFIENSRVCDPFNDDDLQICIQKLKYLHSLNLHVNHSFDLFKQIDFYESLWKIKDSLYRDYTETKKQVFTLKNYVEKYKEKSVLTHIDAVPDNFLITDNNIYMIDWEYAAMQDPHVDIAMFCIYSIYSREEIDKFIDIYFENNCNINIRIKIYCYISICGLLWSNWCEYKQQLGVEFGEYSIRQYRYAKDYYKIAKQELEKIGESI